MACLHLRADIWRVVFVRAFSPQHTVFTQFTYVSRYPCVLLCAVCAYFYVLLDVLYTMYMS